MFKHITIVLLLISSLLVFPQRTISVEPDIIELTLEEKAIISANKHGVDSLMVAQIVKCESNWKVDAVGDRGLSYGVAQFQVPTFNRMAKVYKEELGYDLSYTSPEDQIELLSFAISKGWGREWTAYRAIKNGGRYSFYSNQLKQHFTVHCR